MNIQDLTEFMDLVKNPAKYEAYLNEIKDAKDQLNAAAELVGKAADIDKLQKKANKLVESAEAKAQKLEEEVAASIKQRQAVYDKMFEDLTKQTAEVVTMKQESDSKFAQAVAIEKDVADRERKLRVDQAAYNVASSELSKKTIEVEEKLAKLRTLLGE